MHKISANQGYATEPQLCDYLRRIGCHDMTFLTGLVAWPLTFSSLAQLLQIKGSSLKGGNTLSEKQECELWREVLTFEQAKAECKQKLGGFEAIAEVPGFSPLEIN